MYIFYTWKYTYYTDMYEHIVFTVHADVDKHTVCTYST